jgi:putative hydrolase of the HAD superfamily
MTVEIIGVDADDTLWHNETYFQEVHAEFGRLLSEHADPSISMDELQKVSGRNIGTYGYGVKGFTLSMMEVALDLGGARVNSQTLRELLNLGRDLMQRPMEPIEGVREALSSLADRAPLVLITKGDLFHQEVKLAASGFGAFFSGVEIVSEKSADSYRSIFRRHGFEPSNALMVGNSLRSDVLPALEAGARAALVPYVIVWAHEAADAPSGNPRYREIDQLMDLVSWIDEIRASGA